MKKALALFLAGTLIIASVPYLVFTPSPPSLAITPLSAPVVDASAGDYVSQTIRIHPSDDTQLNESYPDTPGIYSTYRVGIRSWDASVGDVENYRNIRSLLKFDLSGIPEGAKILDAELRLYSYYTGYTIPGVTNVQVRPARDDWTEDTATWNDPPWHGGPLDVWQAPAIMFPKVWVSWMITDFVENEFETDKTVSLMLRAATESYDNQWRNVYFRSKDYYNSDYHPYLKVTYVPPSSDVIYPSDDAELHEGYPDTLGFEITTDRIGIRSWDASVGGVENYRNIRSLLKFDLSGIPEDVTILDSKLWLYCYYAERTRAEVTDVQVRAVGDDQWTEGAVTWNDQPPYENVLDVWVPPELGDNYAYPNVWVSWEVTEFLESELGADETVSLMLRAETESYDNQQRGVYFRSEEAAENRPYLEVKYVKNPTYTDNISVAILKSDWIAKPGGSFDVEVEVRNNENLAIENVSVYAYVYSDNEVLNVGGEKSNENYVNLSPNEIKTLTLPITIKSDALPGLDNLRARAELLDSTYNQDTRQLLVENASIHVRIGKYPNVLFNGSGFKIQATVANLTSNPIENAALRVYAEHDNELSTLWNQVIFDNEFTDPSIVLENLVVENGVRLAGTTSSGTFLSQPIEIDPDVVIVENIWAFMGFEAERPENTSMTFQTRTSPDAISWSAWSEFMADTTAIASEPDNYFQVMATLTTENSSVTPVLRSYLMAYRLPWNKQEVDLAAGEIKTYTLDLGVRDNAKLDFHDLTFELTLLDGAAQDTKQVRITSFDGIRLKISGFLTIEVFGRELVGEADTTFKDNMVDLAWIEQIAFLIAEFQLPAEDAALLRTEVHEVIQYISQSGSGITDEDVQELVKYTHSAGKLPDDLAKQLVPKLLSFDRLLKLNDWAMVHPAEITSDLPYLGMGALENSLAQTIKNFVDTSAAGVHIAVASLIERKPDADNTPDQYKTELASRWVAVSSQLDNLRNHDNELYNAVLAENWQVVLDLGAGLMSAENLAHDLADDLHLAMVAREYFRDNGTPDDVGEITEYEYRFTKALDRFVYYYQKGLYYKIIARSALSGDPELAADEVQLAQSMPFTVEIPDKEFVTVEQLLSDPDTYDNTSVWVKGFVSNLIEDNADIYYSTFDLSTYEMDNTADNVSVYFPQGWLTTKGADNGSYAVIHGVFNAIDMEIESHDVKLWQGDVVAGDTPICWDLAEPWHTNVYVVEGFTRSWGSAIYITENQKDIHEGFLRAAFTRLSYVILGYEDLDALAAGSLMLLAENPVVVADSISYDTLQRLADIYGSCACRTGHGLRKPYGKLTPVYEVGSPEQLQIEDRIKARVEHNDFPIALGDRGTIMANDGADGKSDVPVGVVFVGDASEWRTLEQLLIGLGFKGGDILKQHLSDKYTAEIMLYYEYEDYSAPVKWLFWSYTRKQDHLRVKSMGWWGSLEYTYVGTIEKEPAEYIPHLLRWSEGKLVESYEVPQMHVAQLVIKKGDSPLTTITRTIDEEGLFKITETWKLEYLCEVDYGNASDGYTYAEGVFNDGWAYVIEITFVSQEVEEIPFAFVPWLYWF